MANRFCLDLDSLPSFNNVQNTFNVGDVDLKYTANYLMDSVHYRPAENYTTTYPSVPQGACVIGDTLVVGMVPYLTTNTGEIGFALYDVEGRTYQGMQKFSGYVTHLHDIEFLWQEGNTAYFVSLGDKTLDIWSMNTTTNAISHVNTLVTQNLYRGLCIKKGEEHTPGVSLVAGRMSDNTYIPYYYRFEAFDTLTISPVSLTVTVEEGETIPNLVQYCEANHLDATFQNIYFNPLAGTYNLFCSHPNCSIIFSAEGNNPVIGCTAMPYDVGGYGIGENEFITWYEKGLHFIVGSYADVVTEYNADQTGVWVGCMMYSWGHVPEDYVLAYTDSTGSEIAKYGSQRTVLCKATQFPNNEMPIGYNCFHTGNPDHPFVFPTMASWFVSNNAQRSGKKNLQLKLDGDFRPYVNRMYVFDDIEITLTANAHLNEVSIVENTSVLIKGEGTTGSIDHIRSDECCTVYIAGKAAAYVVVNNITSARFTDFYIGAPDSIITMECAYGGSIFLISGTLMGNAGYYKVFHATTGDISGLSYVPYLEG